MSKLEVHLSPEELACIGCPDPQVRSWLLKYLKPVLKLCFRPKWEGLANLPRQGPYLLVANHNAGVGLAELCSIALFWADNYPQGGKLTGFAHPIGYRLPWVRALHRRLGNIPSTYEAAGQAAEKGVSILVLPGGDHDSLAPVWLGENADFAGRLGFLRIAHKYQLPIVPLAISGSRFTAPILWRSQLLANLLIAPRFFLVKRWGLSLLAVLIAIVCALVPGDIYLRALVAYLFAGSPLSFLPIFPATIRFRVGKVQKPPVSQDTEALRKELTQLEARFYQLLQ